MKVTLVRHGETNYNVKGLCSEKPGTNVHLTTRGELQAKLLATKLSDYQFDVIYTSELYRTQQTAGYINTYHEVTCIKDKRLNDRYTGFDGKPIDDFYETIRRDPLHARPPGGETLQEAKERVENFLEDLTRQNHGHVLIVTHSIIIKLITVLVNKKSLEELFGMNVPPASCVRLDLGL